MGVNRSQGGEIKKKGDVGKYGGNLASFMVLLRSVPK